MSGDCEQDAYEQYVLARTCGDGCPCCFGERYIHLNLKLKSKKDHDTPDALPEIRYINVRGREEHEAIVKDAKWCRELGLDAIYEKAAYLKRWGEWLTKD